MTKGGDKMDKKKILIVEDEEAIARFLELELNYEGYDVIKAFDGRDGLKKALEEEIDLIILDIMLPKLNGMEVCRRIRKESLIPIIMLTAKDDTLDKVMGLDLGANDYMTKPFAIEELLARIRATLRKSTETTVQNQTNSISLGKLEMDLDKRIVKYLDSEVELTKKEFDLLEYLLNNKNIVVSRESILQKVWGYDFYGDTNIVDVYIRYLRSKLDDFYKEKIIHTVRGVGYIIKDEN